MNKKTPAVRATERWERLLNAAVAETVEYGYAGLTVERIIRRAGTSRASFYSQFTNKEAVIEAAYKYLTERYIKQLVEVCGGQHSWPLKVKVGIGVTLDMVSASPVDAQFVTMDAMFVNDDFRRRVLSSRDRLARLLAAGRTETPLGAELPGVIESALVGGISGVIAGQLRAGQARHLPALASDLVELTLVPYLGRKEAAEVARRPLARFEAR